MTKSLFLIIALTCHLSLILAVSNPNPKKSRLIVPTNLYASETTQVQLVKDVSGFYVSADLADDYAQESDSDFNPDTVRMTLGLYTSQTLLADNCLYFQSYNCTKYSCTNYSSAPVIVDSPYFNGTGFAANASVYLDYKEWNVKSNVSIADSCETNTVLPYGRMRSGVIGMGLANKSNENYLVAEKFSVTLAQDLQSGHIGFGTDLSQIDSTLQVANFTTDENWHIQAPDLEIQLANYSFSANTSIIFDINVNAIGLPWALFNQTMQYLSESIPMNCSSDTNQPICYYSGSINALPNITLSTQNQSLTLAPWVYVQNISDPYVVSQTITLNLKALSPQLADESYVTDLYSNHIILDAHVMRGYFMVFDGTTSPPTIGFYNGTMFHYDGFWVELLVGAIILLAVVFCCCFCKFDKKDTKKIHATEDETMTMSMAASQVMINPNERRYTEDKEDSPPTAVFYSQESNLQTHLLVHENEPKERNNTVQYAMAGFSFNQPEDQEQ